MRRITLLLSCLSSFVLASCGGKEESKGPDTAKPYEMEPGVPVGLQPSNAQSTLLGTLTDELGEAATAETFAQYYKVNFATELGYDPSTAQGLDLIAASPLGLDEAEQTKLKQNGFVISRRQQFPSFVYGYQSIYMADLPVYVSADSILDAVHRSYDDILKEIELVTLSGQARQMLTAMRSGLESIASEETRADCDFFLTVALSLLDGKVLKPAANGDADGIESFVSLAEAAGGDKGISLFGVERAIDFSQFKPRGHYTDDERLGHYFKALMWLGRIDFRLLETQSDGSQVFRRRQFDAMLALRSLMNDAAKTNWSNLDTVIRAFVGESDYMTPPEVDTLLDDLGGVATAAQMSDAALAQAVIDGGYGQQLISSHIVFVGPTETTLPLSLSFALFGQRYVIDSHVLSNVVWDRTEAQRMMPNPLDVAFGALDNDQAGGMLAPDLVKYKYAPQLHGMRLVANHQPEGFWDANLYNTWLSSLRALSPNDETENPAAAGLPALAATEAWGKRILNTQLASWAELRHDTVLYAKQSYTGGAACEFPDAYVDPYPEFYAALGKFADKGASLSDLVRSTGSGQVVTELSDRLDHYFEELSSVVSTLGEMATSQRNGTPFTEAQLTFINESVGLGHAGCVPDGSTGWYARLFFDNYASDDFDPTITDVHTQPTDEVGNDVGKVLHVGTGFPRLMVVTTNNCEGAHAYVGLSSSYYEHITEDYERLTDETWSGKVQSGELEDVAWAKDLIVGDSNTLTPGNEF
jgi:hypothetical protein